MPQSIWLTVLIAFVISVVIGPLLIRIRRRRQIGQQVRDDGPAHHLKKAGTPTAGGVIFLIAAGVALLIQGYFTPLLGMAALLTMG
ncbi:MAG: phospho-N-acetylmuramoyl-pentapeptide-transferase, partial [Firmicutes bacterium]|nr:phospho-N-acetylmuramoyl-pentapeptide-transferase [Bacillota bacterium]